MGKPFIFTTTTTSGMALPVSIPSTRGTVVVPQRLRTTSVEMASVVTGHQRSGKFPVGVVAHRGKLATG